MHKAIEDGKIGRVTVAECIALLGRDRAYFARDPWRGTWKGEGGGALMNQAIHMIDMLLWMVGVPTEVYGRWATLKHGEYIDVEDSACAVVSFENGPRHHHSDDDVPIVRAGARLPHRSARCGRTYRRLVGNPGTDPGDH